MKSIAHFSIKKSVTTSLIIVTMIAAGLIGILNMKSQLLPNFNIPVALIGVTWTGAAPEDVDKLITTEIQDAIKGIEGIKDITGYSSPGSSQVVVQMKYGYDVDEAVRDMQSKINNIKSSLPDDSDEPYVSKIDINAQPIITYNLSGKDLTSLYAVADDQIKPLLEKITGVSQVDITGGLVEEVRVEVDPNKLSAYSLTVNDLKNVLLAANINTPLGNIKSGDKEFRVKIQGEIKTVEQVKDIVISNKDGMRLKLSDVANITYTNEDISSKSRDNGKDSVRIAVTKSDDGNTIEIVEEVKNVISEIQKSASEEIKFTIAQDDSTEINQSISNVASNALQGIVLAALVLFLFLRNIRATLIVSVALPTSVIVAFAFLYIQGITLNIISLMGLALGVGMLVDNSIVVIDNIYRRMEEEKEDKVTAAANGASEMTIPIITSTLTTVAVFLPMVVKQGMAREIFHDMSYSITYSLAASIIIALTFIPMAASKFLDAKSAAVKEGKYLKFVKEKYVILLEKALRNKVKTILIAIGTLILSMVLGVMTLKTEFMPSMDNGEYQISGTLAKGLDLEKANRIGKEVESIVAKDSMTKSYSISVTAEDFTLNVTVPSKADRKESLDDIISSIRSKLQNIPDVKLKVAKSGGGPGGGGSNGDVELKLYGSDSQILQAFSDTVLTEIKKQKGLVDVSSSNEGGNPEITFDIDRDKASYYGLSVTEIANLISYQVKGKETFTIKSDGNDINVTLRLAEEYRNNIENILNLYISTPSYGEIKLSEIASMNIKEGAATIQKENGKNIVSIYANIEGIDLTTATNLMKQSVTSESIPTGVTYSFGGNQEQFQDVMGDLAIALLAAICLIYFILAAQFESYSLPIIIMVSAPLSLIGVFLGFIITRVNFSIMSMVGIIMLLGIVVNNAIILIDYIVALREKGYEMHEAIKVAGRTRLRPILMTTGTTVFGMVPLALGLGQGSEYYQGMAITVIFGLLFSTLLTLVIIPVVYVLEENLRNKISKKFKRKNDTINYKEN